MDETDHVLAAIDHAVQDWDTSPDAMRSKPVTPVPSDRARTGVKPAEVADPLGDETFIDGVKHAWNSEAVRWEPVPRKPGDGSLINYFSPISGARLFTAPIGADPSDRSEWSEFPQGLILHPADFNALRMEGYVQSDEDLPAEIRRRLLEALALPHDFDVLNGNGRPLCRHNGGDADCEQSCLLVHGDAYALRTRVPVVRGVRPQFMIVDECESVAEPLARFTGAFRRVRDGLTKIADAAVEALRPLAEALRALEPPSAPPHVRERALYARQNRNTGPGDEPFNHRGSRHVRPSTARPDARPRRRSRRP